MRATYRIMIYAGIIGGVWAITNSEIWSRQHNRVSPVRSNMRSIATALESYFLDHGEYPAWTLDPALRVLAASERSRGVP